jgi:hypothetical protein
MFKILRWAFLIILLATGGLVVANWQMVKQIARFSPVVWPAFYGTPANRTEAQQQDIDFLRRFVNYDRSYSPQELRDFHAHVDALATRAGRLSDAQLFLGAARAAALSDNGHTNIGAGALYRRFNRVGVKVFWFADGLFIVRARRELGDLVGTKIVAVEGVPIEDVVRRLGLYFGGAENWRRLYATLFLESPEIMHAAGLSSSSGRMTIRVANSEGAGREITLEGVKAADAAKLPPRWPWMTLTAAPMADEGGNWQSALPGVGGQIPLYLQRPDDNFFWTRVGGGVYVRPHLLLERAETPILAKFEAVIRAGTPKPFDFMIVDLRQSPGGDFTKVLDFAKAAPNTIKPGGRLYIATASQTFSAAMVTTALLKHHGGDRSVIIGERAGDREQFWAETGLPFTLPNSGFSMNYATGYHDWEKGCAGKHEYCFDRNLIHEVPAGSLSPMVPLAATYAEYASGRDVVLDWIGAKEGFAPVAAQ